MTAARCWGEEWLRGDTPCPKSGVEVVKDIPRPSKRNPGKTVGAERGHQKPDRLKPQSQKLIKLITWTTVWSSSMKL